MNNAETIQHNGKEVLVMDISNVPPIEVIKRIKAVEEKLVDYPLGSAYVIVFITNLSYNKITSANLDDFSELFEKKYIKAIVVVDESMDLPEGSAVTMENGTKIFADQNAALNWVTSQ